MVTRRKYKAPQGYRDGGRVLDDVLIAGDPEPVPQASPVPPPPPERPQEATPPPQEGNPLMQAAEAARRADDIQRQRAQQPTDPIDAIPGLTDHKRAFLRQYPELLHPAIMPVMAAVYQAALRGGVADDTAEMDERIVTGIANHFRQLEQLAQLTSADARPTPENRERREEAAQTSEELQREVELLQAELEPAPTPAPPPVMRRSIPVSAPVSREAPMASGGRLPTSQITLNRDEREIAHASFRHLSPAQAELEYAKNKKLMLAMKADGRIQGDR